MYVDGMKHEGGRVLWEKGDQMCDFPSPLLSDMDGIDRVFTS